MLEHLVYFQLRTTAQECACRANQGGEKLGDYSGEIINMASDTNLFNPFTSPSFNPFQKTRSFKSAMDTATPT